MEYRKLIKFGNSSYVISLPSSWIRKNSLKKGDSIFFEENGNGEILLSSNSNDSREVIRKVIIKHNTQDLKNVNRKIVSGYIYGAKVFEIYDDNLKENSKKIKEMIHDLMGLEVMEQTHNRIIAKDLLDTSTVSLSTLVRRIDIIARSMIEDSIASLKKNMYSSINDRDKDVNRLTYLSFRVIRSALRNPTVAKNIGLDNEKLLDSWRLFQDLEKIADESKRVAKIFSESNLKKTEAEDIEKVYLEIQKYYVDVMKAYYNKDREKAFEIASRKAELIQKCNDLFVKYKDAATGKSVEKLKGLVTFARNICRIVYA